ncbi:transposase [Liquorilactobacillus sucicola]|uniref:transposase n=1 Tax=Liquorilactobacillus sucicola TaxID=519050 RepID=UPI0009DD06D3
MSNTIEILRTHHDEIHNTFITQYSNSSIESFNAKIQVIKCTIFDHRNYNCFRFMNLVLAVLDSIQKEL